MNTACRVAVVVGMLAGGASLLAFGADHVWCFDTLAAFRVQGFVLTVGAAAVLWAGRCRRSACATTALAVVAAVPLAMLVRDDAPPADRSLGTLRLLTYNQRRGNPRLEVAAEVLARHPADLLLVQEVEPELLALLTGPEGAWRIVAASLRETVADAALLAARDLPGHLTVVDSGVLGREHGLPFLPAPWLRLRWSGRELTLLGFRAPPPRGPTESARAREAVDAALAWLRGRTDPLVVLGDLNATPWNRTHRRLVAACDLVDSLQGRGLQPTFPVDRLYRWPARIPIDHCLHARSLVTLERRVITDDTGSDHAPVLVELAWRRTDDGTAPSADPPVGAR